MKVEKNGLINNRRVIRGYNKTQTYNAYATAFFAGMAILCPLIMLYIIS